MTHNPAWHAEYLVLETAEADAREAFRAARKALDRKPTPAKQSAYDAALAAFQAAGKARWDMEMAATVIVKLGA